MKFRNFLLVFMFLLASNFVYAAELSVALEGTVADTSYIPKAVGTSYYVDASMPDDTGSGISPDVAKKTIGAGIALLSDGDFLHIKAGTYTETGLNLNKNACEMLFEIGAVIAPATGTALTISGNYCRVTCDGGVLMVIPGTNETGVLVSGHTCYLNEVRVSCFETDEANSADIGFDITGDSCDLRRCRVTCPDIAAFKIQGDKIKIENCVTGGGINGTIFSSIGYWITNSCDQTRLKNDGSQGHGTAGYQVDTGCTNGVIEGCYSGGGDGKFTDADNSFVWSNFSYEKELFATTTLDGSTAYNMFKITGAIKLFNIFGHVETVIANTSSTIHLDLHSTNASVNITDSSGAPNIQAAVVGTVYAKDSLTTDPLGVGEPDNTPAIIENTNFRDPKNPVILIEDNSADTYVRLVLSDAVASGVIHWHITWESISDDGFVEAQ